MCLAIPGRVEELDLTSDPLARVARVSFGDITKHVNVSLVPETVVGDYVLVHVGVAIQRIDPAEAERTYALLKDMGELETGERR